MTITVLALDQSPTATGWAIGSPGDRKPRFGVFKMETWGNNEGARLKQLHRWMMDKCAENSVTHLFYEQPFLPSHGNFNSIEPQLFLIGHINFVAALLDLPVQQVPMQAWRKRFLGTSKAPPGLTGNHARKELKQMAIKACAIRGWLAEDDNAAEALGILDYGCSVLDRKHAGQADVLFKRAELTIWRGEK